MRAHVRAALRLSRLAGLCKTPTTCHRMLRCTRPFRHNGACRVPPACYKDARCGRAAGHSGICRILEAEPVLFDKGMVPHAKGAKVRALATATRRKKSRMAAARAPKHGGTAPHPEPPRPMWSLAPSAGVRGRPRAAPRKIARGAGLPSTAPARSRRSAFIACHPGSVARRGRLE